MKKAILGKAGQSNVSIDIGASTGSFRNYVSKLNANSLIVKDGDMIRLSEELG